MIVTPHAMQRWSERFPGMDLALSYAQAGRRAGRKTKAKLRASCPLNADYATGLFKGRYYAMTPDQIVFVMAPPETVITVFRLGTKEKD